MISNETNNVFSFIHNDALGCRSPLKDLSLLGRLLADWRFEKSKSYYYLCNNKSQIRSLLVL